ncbi:MAG: hypothetical protein MK095_01530 [Phycisphaerales bacterium]|nr:hypothetical protein [Phycisphaerales bacterium]
MPTPRHLVNHKCIIIAMMALVACMGTACHQVQLAGGAHLAPPLKPVQSKVYPIRLGSMATTPEPTSRDGELDPWHIPPPLTSHATE